MVQILIPYPNQLHHFVSDLSARNADKTRAELRREIIAWQLGLTPMPHAVFWETDMDGVLLARYGIMLEAGYSAEQGPWASFVSLLWMASAENSWQAAQRIDHMQSCLKAKGVKATVELDTECAYQLRIADSKPACDIILCVGEKSPEAAMARWADQETFDEGNNPLILQPDDGVLSFDPVVCSQQLERFQAIVPPVIDALYEAFGMEPPQISINVDLAYPSVRGPA